MLLGGLGEPREAGALLRNNQHVRWGLGRDVAEGKRLVVLLRAAGATRRVGRARIY